MTANAYDQEAVDLYFDNSTSQWAKCFVSVGHTSWTAFYDMERVSGTQYLWKLPANFNGGNKWGGASGWVVSVDKWDGYPKNENITVKYVWHGDKNVTKLQISAWKATNIYKANGTESVSKDGTTKTVYKVTSYTKNNYTVTINTVEGGTLTVKDYDNNAVASGASKIHLTVLKFSATPASGYVLDAVEINDGTNTTTIAAADLATKTHTLTSNVTINPVWRATTSTVTVTATATNGTVTGGGVVEEGTSVTLTATPDAGYKFANWTVGGAEVSTANPYTFTADADVEVVANFEELPKATIYFVNNGGWSKVQAYAWGDNGTNAAWAGVDITANKLADKIGEYDVYSYTVIQGSYKNVIFNNGSAQTADYVWTDGNYYWHNETAANFAGGTKAQAEEKFSVPVEYDYVYFINTNSWAAVKIYTWTPEVATWPGEAMTKETEQIAGFDVYSYKVVKGTTFGGIKFSDNGGTQTGDLTWQAGKYYAPSTKEWYADAAAAESALAAVVNYDYYLTGSLVGGWDPKQKGIEKDGELYKATFTDLAAGEYEFKITKGDWAQQWNYSNLDKAYEEVSEGKDGEGNPNGNIKIVTTAVKTITVIFDANKISLEGLTPYVAPLTYTVTVPAGTEKCYIAGAMNGWNFQEMTATANANEFTIEIAGARETDGYKYACQASWDYVEKKEDGNDLDANRTWTANDVVAKWGVPPTYTIVGAKAITGANWDPANAENLMTKDGEAYTLTKTGLKLEAGNYEYKVAKNGAWGDGEYPNDGSNQKVTIAENGEYTIVYTYTVGTSLTAVATKTGEYTPAQTVYTVAGDAALCGSEWKADDATNDMTDNSDGTFTWTKTGVTLTGNVGFKVVKNHDFGNGAYPSENWVIDIAGATGVYDVTITFKEDDKNITVVANKTGDLPTETLVYTVTVPAGTEKCYIAGEMNSWAFTLMTQVDATHWTISFDNVTRATQYKYSASDSWAYGEKRNDNRTWAAADEVTEWNKPDTYTVAGTANAFGTEWDAANTANDMFLQGDGTFAWTKTGLSLSENVEFKIVKNHDWNNDKWPAENKVIEITEAGTYDLAIYFNAAETEQEGNGIYVVLTKQTPATPDYTRTVASGSYGTICLPNGSSKVEGAKFYEVTYKKDGYIYAEEVTTLDAGMPYIFQATSTEIKVYYNETPAAATAGAKNGVYGTFDAITDGDAGTTGNVLEGKYLLVAGPKVQKCGGKCSLAANRAYFVVSEISTNETKPLPGRQRIALGCQEENQATGVDTAGTSLAVVFLMII